VSGDGGLAGLRRRLAEFLARLARFGVLLFGTAFVTQVPGKDGSVGRLWHETPPPLGVKSSPESPSRNSGIGGSLNVRRTGARAQHRDYARLGRDLRPRIGGSHSPISRSEFAQSTE
jgi:hypothetical protein